MISKIAAIMPSVLVGGYYVFKATNIERYGLIMLKEQFVPSDGPILLVIMDGIGISGITEGNAVKDAYTPNLDKLMKENPNILLKAHGTAVGLPSDDDIRQF